MALFTCTNCGDTNFSKVCGVDLETSPNRVSEKTSRYLCTNCGNLYTLAVDGSVIDLTIPNSLYQYDAYSPGESSTISLTWINKLRLDITDTLAEGKYRIGWSAEVQPENYYRGIFGGQVQIDDTTVISRVKINMIYGANYNLWGFWSGFAYVDLSEDTHYIDMDYRAERSAYTVKIRNARLEILKVESEDVSALALKEAVPL